MNLQDKIILVTGGAVRVGRAICAELASAGADLACHYHSGADAAKQLKEEIRNQGGRMQLFRGDLSKLETIRRLTGEVLEKFGRIDGLVNNAAVFYKTPLGEVTGREWDEFFNLNLRAVFFLSQEVGRIMLKQKEGAIINIGDAGALQPFPAYLPYSISKAGVVFLTRGLAKALAPHVRVNCVNPGPVMMPEAMSEKERRHAVEQTLLKRQGSARDVALAVRFLLEGGNYITGAVLPVDGGRHIK